MNTTCSQLFFVSNELFLTSWSSAGYAEIDIFEGNKPLNIYLVINLEVLTPV